MVYCSLLFYLSYTLSILEVFFKWSGFFQMYVSLFNQVLTVGSPVCATVSWS